MNVRIHRGAQQVGGTCLELSSGGSRIVLDVGLPMGDLPAGRDLLPDVPGLWGPGDGSLLGVFVSHIHPDHIGLADLVDSSVPVYLGARAARLCRETRFFVPIALDVGAPCELADCRPVTLGPFTVTPLRVDHGVDDAFALLVEADGRRLLYSGDLRGHGPDGRCLERLARAAGHVDVLLLEGTRLGRDVEEAATSEADVDALLREHIAAASGPVLAFTSSQNLDRIDSAVHAAQRAGRTAVLDMLGASLWTASGRSWPCEARIRLPQWQRRRIIEAHAFERTRAVRHRRIYDEELVSRANELVLLTRTSSLEELERLGVLLGADAIWSMWPGYLDSSESLHTRRILRRNGVALHIAHASGHASPADLRRLVDAVGPQRVVPVHTERPDRMADVVGLAELRHDGEWWAV